MKIKHVSIRHFRSIQKVDFDCADLAVFCGANSVGKSNILRAIDFAFLRNYSVEDAQDIMPRGNAGSRTLITVRITFSNVPKEIRKLVSADSSECIYEFKLSRSATVYKRLNGVDLTEENLDVIESHFLVLYVPANRDLYDTDSNPLERIVSRQIYSGKTHKNVSRHIKSIRQEVKTRTDGLLNVQSGIAQTILGVEALAVSTDAIHFLDLHKRLSLAVVDGDETYSLEQLGSGHQNVVLINLFRQLAEIKIGSTLLLLEEPDAHLHPPVARAIAEELLDSSNQAQIFVTSHSSTLINHIGLGKAQYVCSDDLNGTYLTKNHFKADKSSENLLMRHGIRLAEALFSKMVVLVEGISDATLISQLTESRFKRSLNALDVLIVPVNGKGEFPQLAKILDSLGVDWLAILDFDAAVSDNTIPMIDEEKRQRKLSILNSMNDYRNHVVQLQKVLHTTTKRGKKAYRMLDVIIEELEEGPPKLAYFEGSVVEKIVRETSSISESGCEKIKRALHSNKKIEYRKLLSQHNIILLNPDLENAIVAKESNHPIVERLLRKHVIIRAGVNSPCTREQLAKYLHSIGNQSEVWGEIVESIEESSGFARTEINSCMKIFKESLMQAKGIL